ncbi:MAG TPA: AbrB/MazE/SpoVT family DNA-binding domain-containing protein [Candidatus Acidoferrales bacterium]|nr:AbrB/MazE/SpoVT family DNA-binding domain-containing protein [Candidatus Acidoferrales bacterium]
MIAKVSVKGQLVIPEAVREQARIRSGDDPDVGHANGLIVSPSDLLRRLATVK